MVIPWYSVLRVNSRKLTEVPGKLSYTADPSMFMSYVLQNRGGAACPSLWQVRKTVQQPTVKTLCPWEQEKVNHLRQRWPVFTTVKIPTSEGKFSRGQTIHAEKAHMESTADCLNFPSGFLLMWQACGSALAVFTISSCFRVVTGHSEVLMWWYSAITATLLSTCYLTSFPRPTHSLETEHMAIHGWLFRSHITHGWQSSEEDDFYVLCTYLTFF